MALPTGTIRQIAASWSSITFERTGATTVYALDQIMDGVTQIDSGITITGATINGSLTVTGPMAGMTMRQTTLMVALVMQVRAGLPLPS